MRAPNGYELFAYTLLAGIGLYLLSQAKDSFRRRRAQKTLRDRLIKEKELDE